MAKKVEKWESNKGLLFDTEEEAINEDFKDQAWQKFKELAKDKIGSKDVLATSFDVIWKNRKELLPLLTKGN